MSMPRQVRIVEVRPRDGLQNEVRTVTRAECAQLIEMLADSGLNTHEAGSFVSPKWVPQMADTRDVLQRLTRRVGVNFPVLVPNIRGMVDAVATGALEISVFVAASETFSHRNINVSIKDSLERLAPVMEMALAAEIKVRGNISCVLGCPYEGEVALSMVMSVAKRLSKLGCYELSLGDTIGVGTPTNARDLIEAVCTVVPVEQLALHFHGTYGQALANVFACLQTGISVIDAAAGGLGGCPYATEASGNLATEDLLYVLHGLGIRMGVDLERLLEAVDFVADDLKIAPRSKLFAARRRHRDPASFLISVRC